MTIFVDLLVIIGVLAVLFLLLVALAYTSSRNASMIPLLWRAIGAGLLALAIFIGGVFAGSRWFAKVIIQPVPKIVEVLKPGEKVAIVERVPGPIREVVREVVRTVDHFIFTTQPVVLPPAQLEQARKDALRRFVLNMEIPAGQLIPCAKPKLAEGGMMCEDRITFQAEILEPSAGIFVPLVLPGVFAKPVNLEVTAKVETTKAIEQPRHLFVYLGAGFEGVPSAMIGASYRNLLGSGRIFDTYELRGEYTVRLNKRPETAVWLLVGKSW